MRITHQYRLINLISAWSSYCVETNVFARVCDISLLTRNARTRLVRISASSPVISRRIITYQKEKLERLPRLFYLYLHVPSRWNPDQEVFAIRPGSQQRLERIAIKSRHKLWAGSRCCKMTARFPTSRC